MNRFAFKISIIVNLLLLFNSGSLLAQVKVCEENFTYKIEKSITNISLVIEKASGRKYDYLLFNITNKPSYVQELKDNINKKVIFSGINEGEIYLVQITGEDGCKFTLGGLDGIKIDN